LLDDWFFRNLAVVNVFLVVFCIMSYMATIDWLVYSTLSGAGRGTVGGVLDYHWLGQSTVRDVLDGSFSFSFPDITSYVLMAVIFCNTLALALTTFFGVDLSKKWISVTEIRDLAVQNLIIAILCMVAYVWTMMFIDSTLRITFSIIQRTSGVVQYTSGFVQYQFPIAIWIINAFQGYQESSFMRASPDFTVWLLSTLLILAVKLLRWKPNKS